MNDIVHIEKCKDYNYNNVKQAVYQCLGSVLPDNDNLKGKKILVKVNLLMKSKPEQAITTHPAVTEAVINYFMTLGCEVIIGDSPGGPYTKPMLESVYKETGMLEVAKRTGCQLNYDTAVVNVKIPNGKVLHHVELIKRLQDVDYVVSVPKIKTHAMMTYTGAVKNNFGVIAGLMKRACHFNMKDTKNFADLLIDICQYVNPLVTIMDAVQGMEGDGPSGGEACDVGLIMASVNPYAMDVAAAHIVGIDPESVPTIKAAEERGIQSGDVAKIAIAGETFDNIHVKPFKLPDSVSVSSLGVMPERLKEYLVGKFRTIPKITPNKCKLCNVCVHSCPAQVMEIKQNKVVINKEKCICCYCCHELCPEKAIKVKKGWIRKLLIG